MCSGNTVCCSAHTCREPPCVATYRTGGICFCVTFNCNLIYIRVTFVRAFQTVFPPLLCAQGGGGGVRAALSAAYHLIVSCVNISLFVRINFFATNQFRQYGMQSELGKHLCRIHSRHAGLGTTARAYVSGVDTASSITQGRCCWTLSHRSASSSDARVCRC